MTFASFLATLAGVFKFWDQVSWLIMTIQGTPAEKQAAMIARIRAASKLADETRGDTSGLEREISS